MEEQLVFEANAQKQLEERFALFESRDSPRELQKRRTSDIGPLSRSGCSPFANAYRPSMPVLPMSCELLDWYGATVAYETLQQGGRASHDLYNILIDENVHVTENGPLEDVVADKEALLSGWFRKNKRKRVANPPAALAPPSKRASRRSPIKEEENANVSGSGNANITHGQLLKVATNLQQKIFVKKVSSGLVKNQSGGESDAKVQQTIESYAARMTSLMEEFSDRLVEAKSLLIIEDHRTMTKIKKMMIEGRPRILSIGTLANQLLAYKNIEKELIKEKDELV
ncbi:hypothetical protein GIB67_006950 [Kingdonia uniflora]|uniref:Uncharacterized protein n=1 Tax=Kingdonia uniflora TaxID=39325 RepID=A0A7J7NZ36_9MAGN|nr:hypothetical protein GIB67_006950 [Kingdonia uniflora]